LRRQGKEALPSRQAQKPCGFGGFRVFRAKEEGGGVMRREKEIVERKRKLGDFANSFYDEEIEVLLQFEKVAGTEFTVKELKNAFPDADCDYIKEPEEQCAVFLRLLRQRGLLKDELVKSWSWKEQEVGYAPVYGHTDIMRLEFADGGIMEIEYNYGYEWLKMTRMTIIKDSPLVQYFWQLTDRIIEREKYILDERWEIVAKAFEQGGVIEIPYNDCLDDYDRYFN